MIVQHNVSLKPYNTFGIDVNAKHFCRIDTEATLFQCLEAVSRMDPGTPPFILGGGSNILLTQDLSQFVFHIELTGIHCIDDDHQSVTIEVGAGVNWHELVLWTLEQRYYGLENLSLIPGSVGAAPVQNIGAYGVELKACFESLDAICLKTNEKRFFSRDECQFAYRHSVFKTTYKNQYVITKVRFRLKKQDQPNLSYDALRHYLAEQKINQPTAVDVSQAVIAIRQSKLPDPTIIGNAGSFFKNPVISKKQFHALQRQFPDLVFFPVDQRQVKIPAAWLIQQCNFKGKRIGEVGVHEKQALVIINYGHATGQAIYEIAMTIQAKVKACFGIELTPEVTIL